MVLWILLTKYSRNMLNKLNILKYYAKKKLFINIECSSHERYPSTSHKNIIIVFCSLFSMGSPPPTQMFGLNPCLDTVLNALKTVCRQSGLFSSRIHNVHYYYYCAHSSYDVNGADFHVFVDLFPVFVPVRSVCVCFIYVSRRVMAPVIKIIHWRFNFRAHCITTLREIF